MPTTKYNADVRELLKAGAHFGHKTSRWHPQMKRYIHSQRGKIHIIDLMQTATRLEAAAQFVEKVAASGKKVLFVGTKKHLRDVIEAAARDAGAGYVTNRWLGGTLTNFNTISKRITHLKDLEEKLSTGELKSTYSKREVGEFAAEVDQLNQVFAGVKDMDKTPGVLVVFDIKDEAIAVKEAHRLGVPVVGVVDSNANPTEVDYPIPANDDAKAAIAYIAEFIARAVKEGTAQVKAPVAAKEETKHE